MVNISDSTGVTISGLAVTGYRTNHRGVVPVGIYLHGHDHGIRIVDNHVYRLGNYNGKLGSFNINAHGIAAYGDDPHAAIRGLTIRGNTVDHLRTGASETVVVNGNVTHWAIVGNHIYDDNNIGIDAIGYETTITGPDRYTFRDRARHGLIAHNRIAHIQSRGNPSYWDHGWCNCADGIYVDGGTHIKIRYNHVTTSDIGIEVAAENGKGTADYNSVTHNHITGSLFTGLATGGYCNDKPDCGGVKTGTSHDNRWAYNVLRGQQPAQRRLPRGTDPVPLLAGHLRPQHDHGHEPRARRVRHGARRRHRRAPDRKPQRPQPVQGGGRRRRQGGVRLARPHLHRLRDVPRAHRAGRPQPLRPLAEPAGLPQPAALRQL